VSIVKGYVADDTFNYQSCVFNWVLTTNVGLSGLYCFIDAARDAGTATRPVSFIKSSSAFEVESKFVDSDSVDRRRDPAVQPNYPCL